MEIEVSWSQNENYYKTFWQDFIKYRSNMRKWAIHIGLFIFITNVSIYIYAVTENKANDIILLFAVSGICVILWHFWDKSKWYNLMRSAPGYNKENNLKFTSDSIFFDGPTTKGEMSWEGIINIVPASMGMFLILQKGLSIYIPKSSVSNESEYNSILKFYESNA